MPDSEPPNIEVQKNNPLHGVKLEVLLTELVNHYSWESLANAMNLNCFKSNPSIKSSLKFLRKTPWAREKIEEFYLYKFKRLPRPNDEQCELPPRNRTIPLELQPGPPAEIISNKSAYEDDSSSSESPTIPDNIWGNWKKDF